MEKKTFFKRLFCALGAFVLGFAAAILPTISTINSYASSFDTTYDNSYFSDSWKLYENRYSSTNNSFEMSENRIFQFGSNRTLYYFGSTILYGCGNVGNSLISFDYVTWANLGSHGFSEVPSYNWSTITIGNSVFLYKKDYSSSTYNKVYLVSIDSSSNIPSFTEITVSNLPATAYANTSFGSQLWVYNNVVYFNLDYIVTFDGSSFNFQSTNFFNVYPEQNNLNMQYRFFSQNNNYYFDGSNAYKLNYYNNTFEIINITISNSNEVYNINNITYDGIYSYLVSSAYNGFYYKFNINTNNFDVGSWANLSFDLDVLPKAVNRSLFVGVVGGKIAIYSKSLGNEYYYLGYNQGYTNGYNAGYSAGIANTDNNSAYESGYNAGYNAGLATNSGYSDGYDSGYAIGYREGKLVGSNEGYNNGYNAGSSDGYDSGYSAGVEAGSDYSFLSLVGAVIDAPIKAFSGLFNFEIFGTNIKNLLLALFTASIIVVIVKFALGGK